MADEPDNVMLKPLQQIRPRLDAIDARIGDIDGKVDDLKVGQNSHTGMLMALAGYIRDIDVRVEHLEVKIGAL